MSDTHVDTRRGGRLRMRRRRGAASGFLLIVLGIWGALIPFVGPVFDFGFSSDREWTWTTTRGWLEVLPGVVTVVGGWLLLVSRNRATGMLGGLLTVLAGAWFIFGRVVAAPLGIGEAEIASGVTASKLAWLELTYFSGLGALIVFLGAVALGRLSVRSAQDLAYARGPVETAAGTPEEVAEVESASAPPPQFPPKLHSRS